MYIDVNEEAYFLALADDFSKDPTFYYLLAQELASMTGLSSEEMVKKAKEELSKPNYVRTIDYKDSMKKARVLYQRFHKHPYPAHLQKIREYNSCFEKTMGELYMNDLEDDLRYFKKVIYYLSPIVRQNDFWNQSEEALDKTVEKAKA